VAVETPSRQPSVNLKPQEKLMSTPAHQKPTRDEMLDMIADADAAMDEGSKWPGMTYEQGVAEALRWALGEAKNPLAD
jgi:hypothetical protein